MIVQARMGRTLGLILGWLGLLQYVSWSSKVVFARWSAPAFVAICVVAVAALASSVHSARVIGRLRGASEPEAPPARPWLGACDLGLLLWGLGYLLAALDNPDAGGRLLEMDAFGSFYSPSIALEWLSMAALAYGMLLFVWSHWQVSRPQLVLSAALLLGLLLVGEGATRLWNIVAPTTQGFPTASTELWMRRYVELNNLGFRDRERERAKPHGVRRVVLIGDSYTFGQGVDLVADRVSDRLEVALGERRGAPVEVFNAGVPYTDTLQHIDFLEKMLAYGPDLVVLLYVFNDIYYLQDGTRPTSVTGATTALARVNPMRVIYKNSHMYQQLYLRFRHLYWRFSPPECLPEDPYAAPEIVGQHLLDLQRFVALASSAGVPTRIVPFNMRILLDRDREQINRFIDSLTAFGLPVWPVEDAYANASYGDLIVNQMDHHPNVRANEMLAETLLPLVTDLLSELDAREGRGLQ